MTLFKYSRLITTLKDYFNKITVFYVKDKLTKLL